MEMMTLFDQTGQIFSFSLVEAVKLILRKSWPAKATPFQLA